MLALTGDRTIHAGSTLVISTSAMDADLPANVLNFNLDAGSPVSAFLTNNTLIWPATEADANTTNAFTLRVIDDGQPPLSDTETFLVTVVGRPAVQGITVSNSVVTLTWSAIAGQRYRLQFKADLNDAEWSELAGEIVADGLTATTTLSLGARAQRFFQIVLAP